MIENFDCGRLESLGVALRDARRECGLTLKDVGSDPTASRQWSHSHLSKVERGLEVPKEDLVQWYEMRTGKPRGYLLQIFHDATGTHSNSLLDDQRRGRQWSLDRLELLADLTGERALIYETHDLVAASDGVTSHSLLIDTSDSLNPGPDYGTELISGGVLAKEPEWVSNTLVKMEITLHRSFAVGEWHRIRLLHRSPPPTNIPHWMTASLRYGETRDAVVTIAFNENDVRPAWRIEENHTSEVVTAFTAGSSVVVEDVVTGAKRIMADAHGVVRARFSSLRPGLHYGIGWR